MQREGHRLNLCSKAVRPAEKPHAPHTSYLIPANPTPCTLQDLSRRRGPGTIVLPLDGGNLDAALAIANEDRHLGHHGAEVGARIFNVIADIGNALGGNGMRVLVRPSIQIQF